MTITDHPQAVLATAPDTTSPAGQTSPLAIADAPPTKTAPVVDPLIYIHVTAHADLEQMRIATQQRLRVLTNTEPDADGVHRGWGLNTSHPDVARLTALCGGLGAIEHEAELNLARALRRCAIHPWVKAQVGLGDKQVARLLGAIGDPYWNLTENRPRTVSQLWAYCGLHVLPGSHNKLDTHAVSAAGATLPGGHSPLDTHIGSAPGDQPGVAARLRRGQQANWSTEGKTRAYLIATSCLKQLKATCKTDDGAVTHLATDCACSRYRIVYDQRRAHTSQTHPDWTPGHSHNDALRIASKAILRDLWREAKRLHEQGAT